MQAATALVLFHCRFGDHGLHDHRQHAFELSTYLALPHLFALCAVDETRRPEQMVCGLLVKTNIRYEHPAFLDTMAAAFRAVPDLAERLTEHTSLQPSPVDAESPHPLTEDQALHVFKQLWSEHLAAQLSKRYGGRR